MQNQTPNNWRIEKLENVVEIIDGDRGINYPNNQELLKEGYCLFLNTKNVSGTSFSFSNKQFIDETKDRKLRKGKLQREDFVLTTRGTIGNVAYYSDEIPYDNMRINSGMVILRNNKKIIDSRFFKQYLTSKIFSSQVDSLVSGSAQPQLPIRDLSQFSIAIPDLPTQQKIASILSAFDDKIELNNKIAKTLEEMAQTIFKEWFVKFKFPGHEKVKMAKSSLEKIPDRWRVGLIKDFGRIITGKTPSTQDSSNFGSDYPFITIPDMDNTFIIKTERYLSRKAAEKMNGMLLPKNAICVSCIATVGLVGITTKESLTNQQINSLVPAKDFYVYYLYQIFKSMKKDLELRGSGGTATLIVNKSKFENIELVVPDNNILLQFDRLVRTMYGKVLKITEENQKLAAFRDLLLPKLMKGEIRV